ncbi:TlpA family protein disulfide reductase [Tamlana crocina]|uniref:TlpA family protein disulfide reductase n=1 Tax=Tamlana crocina TaxID=393006 RepID=A0ABX1DE89_9FLAO|nr:TlpA disulfide reductase family protein [Tamlana crocina]NJX16660.1 TlpA family protein disulfide reductase [Tamlana crocina]
MKKIALIACTMAFMGCKQQAQQDYAIIAGHITNKLPNDLTINSYDQSFSEVVNISEDGSFIDTISVDRSYYVLFDGKNPVFLHVEPGYNLNIDYNANDFKNSLKISGTGAEVSNYLVEKRKIEQDFFGNAQATYSLSEADYKAKLQSMKSEQLSFLENYANIPSDFVEKEERNIHYTYLRLLSVYEPAHRQFSGNPNFTVSGDFLNELDQLDYNNDVDFEFSNHYKFLVSNYYRQKADSISKSSGKANELTYLNTVAEIDNETIKNGLLFDFVNTSLNRVANPDEVYKIFSEHSTDEENNKIIEEKYKKITALDVGKPSPKFENYKNYNGGTTSLDDLKGKYVYIDVWATWCGPCIMQIPALKEVGEKYHDKNIEFVSISIDKASDFDKWKTMVKEKDLKGVQLFADNDWSSSFVKDYGIQGIPRFILIDPEGNIVDTNAPRPSDPALIELFGKLEL